MLSLTLLSALALTHADHPRADRHADDTRTVQVHVLERLSPEDARRLAETGKPALFLIELDSLPDDHAGHMVYDCTAPAGMFASVWFGPGTVEPARDRFIVLATLRVLRFPPRVGCPGFVEYRLVEAG